MDEWSTLLVRAQQGDNAAYERFLRQAVPFIKRRGRRYVNSDQLDDLVQESLLTIHRVLHSYQPGLPVEPWISGILRQIMANCGKLRQFAVNCVNLRFFLAFSGELRQIVAFCGVLR